MIATMRTNCIEVSFTVQIPFDRPDRNGTVFTREALKDALQNAQNGLPIVNWCSDGSCQVIGVTSCQPYAIQFDDESQTCRYTIDGNIMYGGLNGVASVENGIVNSFEITSFGISI